MFNRDVWGSYWRKPKVSRFKSPNKPRRSVKKTLARMVAKGLKALP